MAIGDDGALLGHCRGIDDVFHPEARTLVLEVTDDGRRRGADDALLLAQLEVSTLPLTTKPSAADVEDHTMLARHGARLVQLMPPWRYAPGLISRRASRPSSHAAPTVTCC